MGTLDRAALVAAGSRVVEVATPAGPSMERVCVDGPVFDAYTVFA